MVFFLTSETSVTYDLSDVADTILVTFYLSLFTLFVMLSVAKHLSECVCYEILHYVQNDIDSGW